MYIKMDYFNSYYYTEIRSICISYFNGSCDKLCPSGQKLDQKNQICYSICPLLTDGDYCVDDCPPDKVKIISQDQCTKQCPKGFYASGSS